MDTGYDRLAVGLASVAFVGGFLVTAPLLCATATDVPDGPTTRCWSLVGISIGNGGDGAAYGVPILIAGGIAGITYVSVRLFRRGGQQVGRVLIGTCVHRLVCLRN